MNLPELGSVALGITDIRKEAVNNNTEDDSPMEIIHRYDFDCNKTERIFDLLSTFPDSDVKHEKDSIIYESFTNALMTQKRFNLRASIIIYENDQINNQ